MANRDLMTPFEVLASRACGPFREVTLDFGIEVERNREVALCQFCYQCCRGHDFCQGSDVVHGSNVDGGSVRVVAQIAEGVNRDFAFVTDSERRAGEGLIRDGSLKHRVGWLEERFAADVHGLRGHGIRGEFQPESGLHVYAWNCDRQTSAQGHLPEQSAGDKNLGDVADAEYGKPSLCLREALDQIR